MVPFPLCSRPAPSASLSVKAWTCKVRSNAALKIGPRGRPLFVVRVRRDCDAVVHGSLDIARFVVEISTLGIRGGNGSIHSRTQSPRLQEQTPRTLTGCLLLRVKLRFSFDLLKSSTAKPSRFPRFPESVPEGGARIRSVPYLGFRGRRTSPLVFRPHAPPRVPRLPNQPPGFPNPRWGTGSETQGAGSATPEP